MQKTKIPHIIWLDGDRNEKYSFQPKTYFWENIILECVVNQYLEDDFKVEKHSERDLKDMDTEDIWMVVIKIKEKRNSDLQGGP